MNLLIDALPCTVEIGGAVYPISFGFRTSILFELLMKDEELSDREKISKALRLYYPVIPDDLTGAVDKLIWFYACGKLPEKKTKIVHVTNNDGEEEDQIVEDAEGADEETLYSYDYDAPYIYAAFLGQYGIDLNSIDSEDLHWWKFSALFQSLSSDCQLMRIIDIRGTKITDKMSKDQKAYYRKMQKIYALPESRGETNRKNAIIAALKKGSDVSSLL